MFTVTFDGQIVGITDILAENGVQVDRSGEVVTVKVTKAIPAGSRLFTAKLTTSEYLVSGSYTFMFTDHERKVENTFSTLTIFEMGDVNLDGKVNSRDATLIKQFSVKMTELTDVQKAYANVYVDYDKNGNPTVSSRDALLIQQYVVKMDVTLGNRVEVTFVAEETEEKRSVAAGETLKVVPDAPAGRAWSASMEEYVAPDYANISDGTRYYLVTVDPIMLDRMETKRREGL